MQKYSLIRVIYLYTFATLGLVLLIISGVRFIDMGLKALVFTKAEEDQNLYYNQPLTPYSVEKIERLQGDAVLSEEEKNSVKQWLQDYKTWKENQPKVSYTTIRRHRDASINLAMILIGLPLYLYHWLVIKRELKASSENNQEKTA